MGRLVRFLIVTWIVSGWVFAQDERDRQAPAGGLRLIDLPKFEQEGSRADFSLHWQAFLAEAKRLDASTGRAIIQKYSVADWDSINAAEPPVLEAASVWICDFVSDYTEGAYRQDWLLATPALNQIAASGVSVVHCIDHGKLPAFQLQESEYCKMHVRKVRTLDYELNRIDNQLGVLKLPQRAPRGLPNILDFRIAAWMSHSQWTVPTTQSHWLNLLENHCKPFSFKGHPKEDFVELFLLWKASDRVQLITVKLSKQEKGRVLGFAIWKAIYRENDKTMYTRVRPEFESRVFYGSKDNPSSIVSFEAQTGAVHRIDFLQLEGVIPHNLYTAEDFYGEGHALMISPEFRAIFDDIEIESIVGSSSASFVK